MINGIGFGNNNNIIEQQSKKTVNIDDLEHGDVIGVSDSPSEYFVKCFKEMATTRIGKWGDSEQSGIEAGVKGISYKYKELLDEINDKGLEDNVKKHEIDTLNDVFACLVEKDFSIMAFDAKNNEEYDYHTAVLSKNNIVNTDKDTYDNIIRNHNSVLSSLDKLENILKGYGRVYCEAFIDNLQNNSAEEAAGKSFEKIRNYSIDGISYDNAMRVSCNLSGKHNFYKYEGFFNIIEGGKTDNSEKNAEYDKKSSLMSEFEGRLSRYGNVFYKSLTDSMNNEFYDDLFDDNKKI